MNNPGLKTSRTPERPRQKDRRPERRLEKTGLSQYRTTTEKPVGHAVIAWQNLGDSVGGAAFDRLKEGRGLEHIDRLRYLRFNEFSFARGHGGLCFGGLVIR